MRRDELFALVPDFVEAHWPKNDTAAEGGNSTPGRGEATATVTRFISELPEELFDE